MRIIEVTLRCTWDSPATLCMYKDIYPTGVLNRDSREFSIWTRDTSAKIKHQRHILSKTDVRHFVCCKIEEPTHRKFDACADLETSVV